MKKIKDIIPSKDLRERAIEAERELYRPYTPKPDDPTVVFIVRGDDDEMQLLAEVQTTYRHVVPRSGWELKDCLTMGLPQAYRFAEVSKVKSGHAFCVPFFVIWI